MVAGALGVCLSLRRVLVALRMVILAVVFGGAAMRLGRVLVMLRSLGVCLIGHDWTFCWPANAGPTQAARIVLGRRLFVEIQLQPFCSTGFAGACGRPAARSSCRRPESARPISRGLNSGCSSNLAMNLSNTFLFWWANCDFAALTDSRRITRATKMILMSSPTCRRIAGARDPEKLQMAKRMTEKHVRRALAEDSRNNLPRCRRYLATDCNAPLRPVPISLCKLARLPAGRSWH